LAYAAHYHLALFAGEEISVAATKTYTAELMAIAMIVTALLDKPELQALAESLGAEFRLDPLVHPRTDGDRSPLRYLVPAEELARKYLSNPALFAFDSSAAEGICSGERGRQAGDTLCAAGTRVVSISATGDVLPCASFSVAAGNTRQQSLIDIWRRSELLDGPHEKSRQAN
jgi:MoaA/NifB/PqqE/SkfB family radical SAM enzyme